MILMLMAYEGDSVGCVCVLEEVEKAEEVDDDMVIMAVRTATRRSFFQSLPEAKKGDWDALGYMNGVWLEPGGINAY